MSTAELDPISRACRLLREGAAELKNCHTPAATGHDWTGEPEAKAAYDEHMATADALERWADSIGAGGVESLRGRQCLHRISEPAGEYPALPDAAWVVVEHLPVGGGWVRHERRQSYNADQMRAYVDADRAMRAAQPAGAANTRAQENVALLAEILNRRPAMNAGLTQAYAAWTAEVYDLMGAIAAEPANEDRAQAAPESFLEIPDVQDESGINSHYSRELVLECINAALASHGQAPAQAAPAAVAGPSEFPHEQMDAVALARYKVVPSHESMFHRHAVVAGDGSQQLYIGREAECQNMARKFAGAFLDGAFAFHSMLAAAPTPPAQAAESVTAPAAYSGNLEQELAMLIRRIVSSARRNCEDGSNVLKLANEAWVYLVRKGLNGSPLRDAGIESDPTPPAQAADSVLEDAALLERERISEAQAAPAAVAGPVAFTAEHVTYIRRYGGSCRDCADENGVCPNRGLPCADSEKAIRFVLEALAYGINHGYIAAPTTQPAPTPSPSPASQGDALDAARYRYLRDGDWREHEKLESVIRLQLNTLWDETIDAARAAQEGNSHG